MEHFTMFFSYNWAERHFTQMLQLEKSQYHAAAFFEQDSCSILVCIYTYVLQACAHSTVEMDT